MVAGCSNGTAGAQPESAPEAAPAHGHSGSPPPAAPLRAGERFVNLTMPQAYTPVGVNGGTDEYRCFTVDPKLTGTSFLTGSQFQPQNTDIVHHAIFFRISPESAAAAAKADADSPGPGWTCFGNAGIDDDAAWVAHWAPGADEVLLPGGLGYPMAAGSQLVMQVHYNLLATHGKQGGDDRSAIRLRLAEGDGMQALETAQLAAPVELPCLPVESGPLCARDAAVQDVQRRFGAHSDRIVQRLGMHCNGGTMPAAGNTQRCDYPVPAPAVIQAVAGHMHLLGKSIRIELNPGTPKARTLLDIPAYDFDDQANRPLPQPLAVGTDDTLRVTCTHDAGLRRLLPQLKDVPPRYVVWGEGTSDEMCLGLVIWNHPK